MRCDIIMPVWNELEATKECIDSIVKNTAYPHKLIMIDNGSDRDTAAYLAGLKTRADINVVVMRNEENAGFSRAVNQGIRSSDARYVCIMNNDTIASRGWLEEMIKAMESHPEVGILNPSSNTSGQFCGRKTVDDYAASLKSLSGQIQELSRARGFCMLIVRDVIDKVGLLDEAYGRGYFEETDYSYRARNAGFVIARAKGAYVYHKEALSFKKMSGKEDLFVRNEKMFREKWGGTVRIGYFVDRSGFGREIDDMAVSAARSGHQVWIFIKKGLDWPVSLDHFDIRRVDIGPLFFGIASLYQMFKRRKKKKIEIALTNNPVLGDFLQATRSLHDADVVVSPGREKLDELLRQKSQKGCNGG